MKLFTSKTEEDTMETDIMQFFSYEHLPTHLKAASEPFCKLAEHVDLCFPDGPERSVCLRKLLEAKDAGVRAVLAAPVRS